MKLKKTKYALLALLMASSIGLTACGNKADDKAKTATEQSKDSEKKAEVTMMKGEELQKIEDNKKEKENYLVIDVRDSKEYKEGHVKFAINIPLKDLSKDLSKIESFKDKNVVVYCNSGKKSADAAKTLVDNGFQKVFDAEGVKKFKYNLVTFTSELGPQFAQGIKDGKAALIIDARKDVDFKKGTFKDAVNIMPDKLKDNMDKLPKDKNAAIYVFCYTGNKSAKLSEMLTKDGYTNVINGIDGSKEYDFGF